MRISHKKEQGYTLVLFAGCAAVLIGFVGMAFDMGFVLHQKRHSQLAADAGAIAAAQEIHRGNTAGFIAAAKHDSALNGFTDGVANTTVTVSRPPSTGAYTSNVNYVQVKVKQIQPTFFMRMFNFQTVPVGSQATAYVGGTAGGGCIILLHPTFDGAFYTDGHSTVLSDCGMWINSNSSLAVDNQGDSTFTGMGAAIHVVGSVRNQGTIYPTPITRAVAAPDPFANMAAPSSAGLTARTVPGTITGTVTLNPGLYTGNINIGTNANVTMNPGLYYIQNGGLKLTQAHLTGSGVTMFFTGTSSGTTILADTISTISLSAPPASGTNGGMEGVLFFTDRTASYASKPWCMDIQSNGTTTLQGVMYFPTCSVLWQSQSTAYIGAYSIIVAQYLRIDGSGTKLKMHSDYSSLASGSPLSSSIKLSE